MDNLLKDDNEGHNKRKAHTSLHSGTDATAMPRGLGEGALQRHHQSLGGGGTVDETLACSRSRCVDRQNNCVTTTTENLSARQCGRHPLASFDVGAQYSNQMAITQRVNEAHISSLFRNFGLRSLRTCVVRSLSFWVGNALCLGYIGSVILFGTLRDLMDRARNPLGLVRSLFYAAKVPFKRRPDPER